MNEVNARKTPVSADHAWELFRKAEKVFVDKGKKVLKFVPDDTNKDVLLKEAIGRSGTLRALTIRVGQRYYVGFQVDMYKDLEV